MTLALGCLLAATALVGSTGEAPEALELQEGERIALIGSTFVEREQRDGHLELALTLAAPEVDVTFRNLGWSGDTVHGRARRFFGTTEEGFEHLLTHVELVAPTLVFVCYGANEAFDGASGRKSFLAGYNDLLDALGERTKRIVLLSAPPLDPKSSPAPEVARRVNEELRWQSGELASLAEKRGLHFVDLFSCLLRVDQGSAAIGPLRDNGMHLTRLGYRITASIVVAELGLTSSQWSAGLSNHAKPLPPARESLRRCIVEKNEAFFHRHRPQNETYLRGFRKHEQGNNAAEIEALAPFISKKDREVFALRASAVGEG